MGAVAGVYGQINVTSGASVALTNEPCADSGDHQTYTITNQTKRYLDPNVTVVVQTSPDGVTWTTASPGTYTLYPAGAKIKFNTAQAAGTQVQIASGNYFTWSVLGQITQWDFDGENNFGDASVMVGPGGDAWAQYIPLQATSSVSAKKFWIDTFIADTIANGALIVVSCVTPQNRRYEGYSYIKQDKISAAVNAIVAEDVTFQITGPFTANN